MARYTTLLGEEYVGRVMAESTIFSQPKPHRVTTPLLVLGAQYDACFSQHEARETAHAYGTEAEIFPDMGHNMMLESGWAAVAERIHTWLESRDLGADSQGCARV